MGKIFKKINSGIDRVASKICGFKNSRVEFYKQKIEQYQSEIKETENEYDKEFFEKMVRIFENGVERMDEEE